MKSMRIHVVIKLTLNINLEFDPTDSKTVCVKEGTRRSKINRARMLTSFLTPFYFPSFPTTPVFLLLPFLFQNLMFYCFTDFSLCPFSFLLLSLSYPPLTVEVLNTDPAFDQLDRPPILTPSPSTLLKTRYQIHAASLSRSNFYSAW